MGVCRIFFSSEENLFEKKSKLFTSNTFPGGANASLAHLYPCPLPIAKLSMVK
jgi:hypothetical protein